MPFNNVRNIEKTNIETLVKIYIISYYHTQVYCYFADIS